MNTILVWVLTGILWTGGPSARVLPPPSQFADLASCERVLASYSRGFIAHPDYAPVKTLQCVQVAVPVEKR